MTHHPSPRRGRPETAARGPSRRRTSRAAAAPAVPPNGALARLLAPHPVDRFLRRSWERADCVVARNDAAHYAALLSLRDVDAVLSLTRPHHDVMVVRSGRGGRSSPPVRRDATGAADIYWLYGMFHHGYTIIVNGVDLRWGPIRDVCRGLESELRHRVGANLYFTPPRAQGFPAHFDDHDVFILQLDGSKRWRLFSTPVELPLRAAKSRIDPSKLPAPRELTLRAGDLLYIPRGLVHDAITSEDASVHLTVGVHVTRWADIVAQAVRMAAENDPRWRRALPLGCAQDDVVRMTAHLEQLLRAPPGRAACEAAVRRQARQFLAGGVPSPDGHFHSLHQLSAIGLTTRLERRKGMPATTGIEKGEAVIRFPGNQLSGPAAIEPALRFIGEATAFTVHELPDELSDESKIVLASRVVLEGLYSIA